MQPITNQAVLDAEIASLVKQVPAFEPARELAGTVSLRVRDNSAETLMRAIIGQQVSVASARAIWTRIENAGFVDQARLAAADIETLRALGASRQKAMYLIAIAQAAIDYPALALASDEAVIAQLTAIKGIGRWTAEIYLMFALGRPDILAAGDLALQEATRHLFALDTRPNEKTLRQIAGDWAPHRNAAAHLLWAYYHVIKEREGI